MKPADRIESIGGELAYTVLAQAEALERQGKSIIHLEIGQPDFATPQHIVDAGVQALKEGKTRYTPTLGVREFREVVAKYVNREHQTNIDADMVSIAPSAKTAIFMTMAAVVNPGDEVIYPNPGFPAYENCINFFGGIPKPLPLLEEKKFSFDLETLRGLISSKTKLIVINSPSNPTGGIIPLEDLEKIAELAKEHDCFVMSDEIYAHLSYEEERSPSIYSLPGMTERTFLVDGFSKAYSMAGWRLGYLVAPPAFTPLLDNLAVNAYACTATFTQYAGIAALEGDQSPVMTMVKEFKSRRQVIVDGLNTLPGVSCTTPGGAFYAFPNIQKTGLSSDVLATRILQEAGVALLPGTAFGQYGEGYLRLSYANSLDNIKEALHRLQKFFSELV